MRKLLLTLNFILLMPIGVYLNAKEKEVKIETTKLNEQTYFLKGKGGNIVFTIGSDGILMVDSQFGDVTPKILEAIRKISDKPIRYLVNTHWHGDHTGGNENLFNETKAKIVAHQEVKNRMLKTQKIRGRVIPPAKKEALPVEVFIHDKVLLFNDQKIELIHVANAHTDGDALVYFKDQNIIHMGDTYFQGKYPFIDLESGGSVEGYLKAIKKVLSIANEETTIVPGHRSLSNKKELGAYLEKLTTIRDRIAAEIKNGKTVEEVTKNTELTQDFDKEFGGWFISGEKFRNTVYKSLSGK